jgi:four helix bundle protein
VRSVPAAITDDSLWKMQVYRFSLFAADAAWEDVTALVHDRRTRALADQLYRALGSISANIAEGYSRGTSRERARFYEYALGSARESRDWYHKSHHVLSEDEVRAHLSLLSEIIRLLLVMVPEQRGQVLREASIEYDLDDE